MSLKKPKQRAEAIRNRLEAASDALIGVHLPGHMEERHIIAIALLRASLDDAAAIVELIRRHGDALTGPAYTLLRPMNEKAKRGAFFAFCANEADVIRFNTKDKMPGGDLARLIEAHSPFDQYRVFSEQYTNAWEKFHSFTHGGRELVGAYRSGMAIGASISEKDVVAMLDHVESIAVMGCLVTGMITGEYDAEQGHLLIEAISTTFMSARPNPPGDDDCVRD